MSRFKLAREAFLKDENSRAIKLESHYPIEKLTKMLSMKESQNITLIHGNAGVGKTTLLNEIYQSNKDRTNILFFTTPFFSIDSLLNQIYKNFIKEEMPRDTQEAIISLILKLDEVVIIMLDEANLYKTEILELIRILSDTNKFKFILSMTKTTIMNEDSFKSRIWEIIELKNLSKEELVNYIDKRLIAKKQIEIVRLLSKANYNLIYKLTKGNFRNTNRLMFKVFEICEYYDKNEPKRIGRSLSNKFIEMAGIDLGMLDA